LVRRHGFGNEFTLAHEFVAELLNGIAVASMRSFRSIPIMTFRYAIIIAGEALLRQLTGG
jgi:hypothetical protein